MNITLLLWSFPLAITLHNLEEALWLAGVILWHTFTSPDFHPVLFWGIAIPFGLGLLFSLPLLFRIGRFLEGLVAK